MAAKWIETLTGSLEQKRRYKATVARIDGLNEPYRTAANAVQRYLMYSAGTLDGDTLVTMFGDLADLWERAATDGSRVRDIVGNDPVEFADAFAQAYSGRQWIDKERRRLVDTLEQAERSQERS